MITKQRSIREQVMSITMIVTIITLVLATILFVVVDFMKAKENIIQQLTAGVNIVANNVSAAVVFKDKATAVEILSSLSANEDILTATIYLKNGEKFIAYQPNNKPIPIIAPATIQNISIGISYEIKNDIIQMYRQIKLDNETVGVLSISANIAKLYDNLYNYLQIAFCIILIVFMLSYWLTNALQRFISKPIINLVNTINTIMKKHDYSVRVKESYGKEIQQLTSKFNSMLEQIEQRDLELADHNNNLTKIVSKRTAELSNLNDQLHDLAYYDPVTDLPNRRYITDKLIAAIEPSESPTSTVLMFVDLDDFKKVNDNYGHSMGDYTLKIMADRFKSTLRKSNRLPQEEDEKPLYDVGRFGGDEFILLLHESLTHNEIAHIAQRIIETISAPIIIHNNEVIIGTSIGIAVFPEHGKTVNDLFKQADSAMYFAKENGKNTFAFYDKKMGEVASKKLELERQLNNALVADEFVLYYQPKINVSTGQVTSVEALIRWNHPTKGLVYPGHFIPFAEESGLILTISDWVLESAIKQAKDWLVNGMPLSISVNFTAAQFTDDSYVVKVTELLKKYKLPAEYLTIEITESALMEDMQQTFELLHMFKEIGTPIHIDDFGTGYSSLRYLSQFPIDCVKIDQSFVKNIPHNKDDTNITIAIIKLAHSLNLDVVAEGVETLEQLNFLKENDCDVIQGFYFSPAISVFELEVLLNKFNQDSDLNLDDGLVDLT